MTNQFRLRRQHRARLAIRLLFVMLFLVPALTAHRMAAQTGGHSAARANSYDDAWQSGPNGWVANAKNILAGGTGQTAGLVLWIGDSLTRHPAMGAWAQRGAGKTPEDQMITNWMHAGLSPQSIDSIDGFALAAPYICSARSYTVGDGLGSWHFMGNGMPADTNPTTARQKLQDCATYPNMLNLTTMLAALPPAQFAIPEVNLDAAQPDKFPDFERMIDLLISHHIVPIIITYTYRQDTRFNQMVDQYNAALVQYAQSKKLPLIDFNNEMLLRLPFSQWMGRFLGDGVHYTSGNTQFPSTSDPYANGGDPATHTTGMALTYSGYGLKGWLGVQKMKEIKQLVIDGTPPPPAPAQMTSPAAGSTFTGSSQTFNWDSGTGVSSYRLDVGTAQGATDIFAGSPTTNRSVLVTGLPTDGRTIWARLSSSLSGTWQFFDYSYRAASSQPQPSGVISIDFVGTGTTMAAAESAGVVAKANWNAATGATRSTPLSLRDETGGATAATITWTSDNVWSTPTADQAGNRRLMIGYLDTGVESATSVTVAGLAPGAYDVYVYADGDNAGATRTAGYQISGAGITTTAINMTDAANTNFNGTFTQANNSAGNYVKFSIDADGFTLTATPGQSSNGGRRAPVNGIQIVPTAVPTPDFTIAASPASRTVTQGSNTSYTVTVGALNGFAGVVNLAVSGLPANATASFTPPSITGSGSATLNVTTTANTPAGSPTLTITGTSGALSHTTAVSLVVNAAPDFTISATPASRTVNAGDAASYTVDIGALNGFAGTVSLAVSSVPPNATASFTPPSVTGSGSATLNMATATNTPAGSHTLSIRGTSGSLTHTATVTLVVNATSAGAAGIAIKFVGNGTPMGAAENAGVVAKANWNNATGATRTTPLALKDETGAATGATVTWTSDNVWSTPITDQAGNRRLMKGYLDTGLERATTVTVTGLSARSYDVYVYADGDNGGASRAAAYQISGPGIATTAVNLTDAGNTNFNGMFIQANNSAGNYVRFTITAGGFTLTATPGQSSAGSKRAPVNAIQIVPR